MLARQIYVAQATVAARFCSDKDRQRSEERSRKEADVRNQADVRKK